MDNKSGRHRGKMAAVMRQLAVTTENTAQYSRRVGRGGAMGANAPPPPPAEKVRLERAKDKLTRKKNAKNESFLAIYQRTKIFTV